MRFILLNLLSITPTKQRSYAFSWSWYYNNSRKVKHQVYDKRDDFSFPTVNFPHLDGDVPLAPSYGVYISQLVRYARVCSDVSDFNDRNLCLTEKLLHQGFRYHKLIKTFSKFYYRYIDLLRKFGSTCRALIQQGVSHPNFYGNIIYKAHKFKNCPSKLIDPLNKLIHKGYKYSIVVKSLLLVFIWQKYWSYPECFTP